MQNVPRLAPVRLRNGTTTNCYLFDAVCFATLPTRFQSVPSNISSHTLRTALHFTQSINAFQPLYMLPNKQIIIGQRYSSPPFLEFQGKNSVFCELPASVRPSVKIASSCLLVLSPQRVCLIGRPQETQKHTWNMMGEIQTLLLHEQFT